MPALAYEDVGYPKYTLGVCANCFILGRDCSERGSRLRVWDGKLVKVRPRLNHR